MCDLCRRWTTFELAFSTITPIFQTIQVAPFFGCCSSFANRALGGFTPWPTPCPNAAQRTIARVPRSPPSVQIRMLRPSAWRPPIGFTVRCMRLTSCQRRHGRKYLDSLLFFWVAPLFVSNVDTEPVHVSPAPKTFFWRNRRSRECFFLLFFGLFLGDAFSRKTDEHAMLWFAYYHPHTHKHACETVSLSG